MQQVEGNTGVFAQNEETRPLPLRPTEQIPSPPLALKKKRNMKTLFWILSGIVFLFTIFIGAYYYYFEYVKPPQYAKQMVQMYEDLEASERLLGSDDVQDSFDYPTAINILNKREELLQKTHNRLSDIKLAKNMFPQRLSPRTHTIQEVLQNFSSLLEYAIAANTDAKQKAAFLEDAYELLVALGRYGPRVQRVMESVLDPRQPRAVGAILSDWETRTAKAREAGDELFTKDLPQLQGIDSAQLKTAWSKANRGLDDILAYLRAQDPNLTLSSSSTVPQPQTQQEQQQYSGIEDVTQFIVLLDSTLNANSAQDILAYRSFGGVSQQDLEDLALTVEKQMNELEEFWPQEDQGQKLQTLEPPPR